MSTIVYKNAALLVGGRDITAQLHELTVNYGAEILDETKMGDDTRRHRAGLLTAQITGSGYADFAADFGQMMYDLIGTDDTVVTVFPDGITLGAASGFSMKSVISQFNLGGSVGAMLDLKFQFDGRGVSA